MSGAWLFMFNGLFFFSRWNLFIGSRKRFEIEPDFARTAQVVRNGPDTAVTG